MKPNPKNWHASGTRPAIGALGKRVRQERQRVGWTPELLAFTTGMNVDAIEQIESGERIVLYDELERIAAALGTTAADLAETPSDAGAMIMTKRGVG